MDNDEQSLQNMKLFGGKNLAVNPTEIAHAAKGCLKSARLGNLI